MTPNENSQNQLLIAISKVVQQRREQLSFTQEELASRAGLHRTYISDIERGARNLSVKSLIRLAIALELTVSGMLEMAEGLHAQTTAGGNHNNNSGAVESAANK